MFVSRSLHDAHAGNPCRPFTKRSRRIGSVVAMNEAVCDRLFVRLLHEGCPTQRTVFVVPIIARLREAHQPKLGSVHPLFLAGQSPVFFGHNFEIGRPSPNTEPLCCPARISLGEHSSSPAQVTVRWFSARILTIHERAEELAELEALTAAATPGPWVAHIEAEAPIGGESMIGLDGLQGDFPPDMYVRHDGQTAPTADIKFIAAARNYVPRLLAEVRRLRGHS
jgi:hypothetical protein